MRVYYLLVVSFAAIISLRFREKPEDIDPGHNFVKIHKDIFQPQCAEAGCHDGSFEPDFRTVQSSYNTLVLHPLIKNNREGTFLYRVVPYDTASSVLHERITNCCFVDQNDRMPFYDKKGLSSEEIGLISEWIMQGAPDVFGNIPTRQCTPPALIKYTLVGIDSAGANISIDRKIINAVGEQIAWRIDPNLASLRIVINVRQEKWTCPDNMLGKYQVSCYSDAGYKKLITTVKCSYDPAFGKIETTVPLQYFPKGKNIFFRLENSGIKDYAYPNMQLLEQIRYQWTFMLTKNKSL